MKNKKTLHLAIALAISSMPLFGVAEAARGSIDVWWRICR